MPYSRAIERFGQIANSGIQVSKIQGVHLPQGNTTGVFPVLLPFGNDLVQNEVLGGAKANRKLTNCYLNCPTNGFALIGQCRKKSDQCARLLLTPVEEREFPG